MSNIFALVTKVHLTDEVKNEVKQILGDINLKLKSNLFELVENVNNKNDFIYYTLRKTSAPITKGVKDLECFDLVTAFVLTTYFRNSAPLFALVSNNEVKHLTELRSKSSLLLLQEKVVKRCAHIRMRKRGII